MTAEKKPFHFQYEYFAKYWLHVHNYAQFEISHNDDGYNSNC